MSIMSKRSGWGSGWKRRGVEKKDRVFDACSTRPASTNSSPDGESRALVCFSRRPRPSLFVSLLPVSPFLEPAYGNVVN